MRQVNCHGFYTSKTVCRGQGIVNGIFHFNYHIQRHTNHSAKTKCPTCGSKLCIESTGMPPKRRTRNNKKETLSIRAEINDGIELACADVWLDS